VLVERVERVEGLSDKNRGRRAYKGEGAVVSTEKRPV
jgi:hypothetical protein